MSSEYVMIGSSFENICNRINESLKHHSPYFIAIDFDETLWNNEQNNFNYFVKELILHLEKKYADQIRFILWTCRTNEQLQNAINIIKNNGIPIAYFNENPEADFGSRKIFANEYWDNAAISTQIIKIS